MEIGSGPQFESIKQANALINGASTAGPDKGMTPKFGNSNPIEDSFTSISEGKAVPDDTKDKKHPLVKFLGTVLGIGAAGFALKNKIGFIGAAGKWIATQLGKTSFGKQLINNSFISKLIKTAPEAVKPVASDFKTTVLKTGTFS